MFRSSIGLLVVLALAGGVCAQGSAPLAEQARSVLKRHCYDCHNGPGSASGHEFDVSQDGFLKARLGDVGPMVVPGKPEESPLFRAVQQDRMPQGKNKLSAEDKAVLRQWIEAGAPPFPLAGQRPFLSLEASLTALRNDLRSQTGRTVRAHLRYFSLAHLHNDRRIPDAELRQLRAALAKAINCLSWKEAVVLPRVVPGSHDTLLAIDLRDLDWDRHDLWTEVLKEYPYGLRFDNHPERRVRQLQTELDELGKADGELGCDLLVVRADWFVATALRPPLYHTLLYDRYLRSPRGMTAGDLERLLGVDVRAHFTDPAPERLARAGIVKSGVSAQNRLVERHQSRYGAYWKSYDFKPDGKRGKLTRYPLGPLSLTAEVQPMLAQQAFLHDGGEILFHLPNGLLGTLLVDGRDNRIDEGPIQVVSDPTRTSGTPAIVTGVSCLSCHVRGVIPLRDTIREGHALFGKARDKVEDLFPPRQKMDELLRRDEQRFLSAVRALGIDPDRPDTGPSEPIGEVARHYRLRYLDSEAITAELFETDAERLRQLLGQKELRQLGLGVLRQKGGVIGRLEWEIVDGRSLMQIVAHSLGATPFTVLRSQQ
jgi:serine/threonine-protein kinase